MHLMLLSSILSIHRIPKDVDDSWKSFFSSLNEDELSVISDFGGPEWKKRETTSY